MVEGETPTNPNREDGKAVARYPPDSTKTLLFVSIPFMLLAVGLALAPLVWAMATDHRRLNVAAVGASEPLPTPVPDRRAA